MGEKRLNYTAIILVLLLSAAVVIFLPTYRDFGAMAVILVALYILLAEVEAEWILDARVGYEMARDTPTFINRLPTWLQIKDHGFQLEIFDFWMWSIGFMWDGMRHWITINRHPTAERPLVLDFYDPHFEALGSSTVRDFNEDKGFEKTRKKQEVDLAKELTAEQYRQRLIKKGILKEG